MRSKRRRLRLGGVNTPHGYLGPIPEQHRHHDVRSQFWIWAGANIAPINWVLGALGVTMGLPLWETVAVLLVGNAIGMAIFGYFVVLGQRTGVTGMVLSRAVFGRKGAYLPAAIQAMLCAGWCAVNTWIVLDLVVTLLQTIGWVGPGANLFAVKSAVALALMVVQVGISWLGYRAITAFERWTVPPTIAILVIMSAVAWFKLPVNWAAGIGVHNFWSTEHLSAVTGVMTAIGIGWGITWLTYAGDYSRFISADVSPRRLYLASVSGQFVPVVWLGTLGASLATISQTTDPGQLIAEAYGSLAVVILLLVLHGPIATNILNVYTFSVAAKALDVRLPRRVLAIAVGVVAMGAVELFVLFGEFGETIDGFLVSVVAWVSPWAAIVVVHWECVARKRIDAEALDTPVAATTLPMFRWGALGALLLGMGATWLCLYAPLPWFQGPVASALGGIDLSWLAGSAVAGGTYWAVSRSREAGIRP
ncbi:cytosine permease [Corynebacterium heidelbergense]|uniref:Cytosine permease n=1 Tax=Corynebacterium heidelbergense TaxID=2055947 RepID=A0A364V3J9_9CORY|nr:cytosine permease [Corynebacterium heidelbergense]